MEERKELFNAVGKLIAVQMKDGAEHYGKLHKLGVETVKISNAVHELPKFLILTNQQGGRQAKHLPVKEVKEVAVMTVSQVIS